MYAIKTVVTKYDTTYDTLRYYEKIGLLPPIHRNAQGQRQYTDADLATLDKILHLRRLGADIPTCQKLIALLDNSELTLAQYDQGLALLGTLETNLAHQIEALQQQQQYLAQKIDHLQHQRTLLSQRNMTNAGDKVKK